MSRLLLFSLLAFAFVSSGLALKCHVCNSAVEGQEDCASSATFDDKDKYAMDCSNSKAQPVGDMFGGSVTEAIGCRKADQNLEVLDQTRVVRECAFTGKDMDGTKRTGNKGIRIYYYQCSDDDLCNAASPLHNAWLYLVGAVVALAVAYK